MQDGGSGGCVPGGEGAQAAETWSHHHCGKILYIVLSVTVQICSTEGSIYIIGISFLSDTDAV